jgi:hypothetical protein
MLQEDYLYLHTSFTEKTSFAVVECVLVKDAGGVKSYGSLGYALLSIFEFSGTTTVDLQKGSPRSIGLAGLDASSLKSQYLSTRITFEMRDFPIYDKLRAIIPQNCFLGLSDLIPGLVGEFIPNPKTLPQGKIGSNVQPI